jgi:transposase-like protein
MKEVVRYSEAFKLRPVEDIAAEKYKSLDEARRRNGIRGASTVTKWIKRYRREDMLPKRVKVETMDEIDELKAARSRIRDLEAALADAQGIGGARSGPRSAAGGGVRRPERGSIAALRSPG